MSELEYGGIVSKLEKLEGEFSIGNGPAKKVKEEQKT
jgi:hypothetical protein